MRVQDPSVPPILNLRRFFVKLEDRPLMGGLMPPVVSILEVQLSVQIQVRICA